MKNNTTKKTSGTSIFIMILAFGIGWLISANSKLKRENKEKTDKIENLKSNQKPAAELYNESNKPCAGC